MATLGITAAPAKTRLQFRCNEKSLWQQSDRQILRQIMGLFCGESDSVPATLDTSFVTSLITSSEKFKKKTV